MSDQNPLHTFAQNSTPQNVQVPNSLPGLTVWAFGQFGPTVAYLIVTLCALHIVFTELMKANDRLLAANERMTQALVIQSESNNRVTAALLAQSESNNRVAQAFDATLAEMRRHRDKPNM